jgi:hypothetical protein
MKKHLKLQILMSLFLSLFIPGVTFSQAGLTNSGLTQQQEIMRAQAGNGFDTGGKSGSALGQLENMSGGKVSTGTNNHQTVVPANTAVEVVKTISTQAMFQNALKMQLASGIASAFIGMLFSNSSNNTQANQAALEAQRQQAVLAVQRAEALRRYNDSIAQARYEKMMQSYKLLNDPNGITIKTLSAGNLQFKSLDDLSAPMTMAEKERQNLIKRGISVTWDCNSWAQVPPNSNRIEETPVAPESEPDKYLTSAIDKIETFQGGRIAALAGRYMLNIKKETMSYLKDASDAALSGNIARMDEVGNVDLRAKISSNALYATGVQTASAYVEQGKGFISGELQEANFAVMKSGGMELLKNYNIYSHVSDDWKLGLRKY